MSIKPQVGETFRHFKGNNYEIITLAIDANSKEEVVVYQALYGEKGMYVRTLSNFMEELDNKQYPQVKQKYRFEKINKEVEEAIEEGTIHPKVLEFLDADNYIEKLQILADLREVITDSMINTIAFASDLEVPQGNIETRYNELRNCIATRNQFECTRLR